MVATVPWVRLEGLEVRRRGRQILGPLDLTLKGAGVTVVLGPNGSGKTTLLRVLHGVERATAGALEWSVADPGARQAFVFQRPVMLRRTVGQNLAYPLEVARIPRAARTARVDHWAAQVGLAARLDMAASRLSGGEKQKLALARALICAPEVLFLDEPCANLDGRATREIEEILRRVAAEGAVIIMSTHDLGQARRLADRLVFLRKGQVDAQGPADVFFEAPPSTGLRAFLDGEIVE
ncbi:MAG: ATP-binding cassette domain-containing protein [Pseudomonadota bacterium]